MSTVRKFVQQIQQVGCVLGLLLAFASGLSPWARASSATLLLEEPYGKLGFFTATGHAAVYLSGVCADSPLVLRQCAPGETGIVLSRYNGVGGDDWIAVPLVPYLYAVENADDVPLFADAKMVAFLRDRYRRKYLETVAPDLADGSTPGGNWYELVGSSYDRTIYGYEIETSAVQDKALIRKYNASANESHFRTVSRNCADFAKDVINFYYPKALHRSVVADVGITTPKQMAKTLVRYSARHPELEFARTIIPQVPGIFLCRQELCASKSPGSSLGSVWRMKLSPARNRSRKATAGSVPITLDLASGWQSSKPGEFSPLSDRDIAWAPERLYLITGLSIQSESHSARVCLLGSYPAHADPQHLGRCRIYKAVHRNIHPSIRLRAPRIAGTCNR